MQVVSTTMALDLIVRCNSVYMPIVTCIRDRLGVYLMILAEYSAEPLWISTFDSLEGKSFNNAVNRLYKNS